MVRMNISLLMAVAMIASGLVIVGPSGGSVSAPTREGIDDVMEIYSNLPSEMIPNQDVQFYIYVYNDYDGSGYVGEPGLWNRSYLHEVKLSVLGIFDSEMAPVANSPVQWDVNTFYNNDGDGYSISQYDYQYFYSDAIGTYLSFRIKTNDVKPGVYHLGIREQFSYVSDFDGIDQYVSTSGTNTDYIRFVVKSIVEPASSGLYDIVGMTESNNQDTLYSGSEYKKVGIRYVYTNYGPVTDIAASLSVPTPGITVHDPVIGYPTLPNHLVWRVTVDEGVIPGMHPVMLTLSYSWNGFEITEAPTMQELFVEPTPLLLPPDHEGMTRPVAVVTQKDTEVDIDVPFTNSGNVDLKGVTVRLDLDNAYYIKGDRHYYNEESNGNKYWTDLTVELGDMAVGQSMVATFPAVNFVYYLPPGMYMVPVDYYAYYHDDGSTGNDEGEYIAGHWQEKGYNTHREIMRSISFPEDVYDNYVPYILIEVEDDPEGPDIWGRVDNSYYTQQQGANNRYIYITIYNNEMYSFQGLTYYVHVDGSSPFNPIMGPEEHNATTLPPIMRSNLNRGSLTSYGSDGFYFYADIKESANPGINFVPVDITGYDEFLQPFTKTILLEVNIQAKQPRFHVLETTPGQVSDDQEVTVTARITNIGLGDAYNVSVFFVSSTTGYESSDPPILIGDLPSGGILNHSFTVKATSDNRYYHGTYYGYIYFAYYDEMGQFYELYSGGNFYLKYEIYARLPDMVIKNVDAPVLDRGQTKDVTITVANIGGSTAQNVQVMIAYAYSMFSFEDDMQDLGDIGPGEEKTFTVKVSTNKEFSDGTTYSFSLYFSYKNVEGRTSTFSEGERETFYLWTKDKVIPSESRQVIETKDLINDGMGSFLLGLLLLIGIIILASAIRGRAPVKEQAPSPPKAEPKEKERTEPKPKAIVEEVPEDEEDDDDWDDDEPA